MKSVLSPLRDTHWGWWYTSKGGVLHFIHQAEDLKWYAKMRDLGGFKLKASCGLLAHFTPAGMFSRMGRKRCDRCCVKMGIPKGKGTPRNEQAKKETGSLMVKAHAL